MGGKSGDSGVEVNDYYLSMHVGVAHNVDAVTGIYYGEKKFWSGYATTNATLAVNNPGLNGGNKKEGGVAGAIQVLLGGVSQVMPNALATRLGRSSGADCPGFRGVTSLFFTGFSSGGFLWTSNTPYLKPLWTTVLRAPKGLNAAKAMISVQSTTTPAAGGGWGGWKYLFTTNLDTTDYSTSDGAGWDTGSMPFTNANGHPWVVSPFPSTTGTTWNLNTTVWLTKTFQLTAIQDLTLRGLFDNSGSVWVNGHLVISEVERDHWINVPSAYLYYGTNTVNIKCKDTGGSSYVALELAFPTVTSVSGQANPAHMIYECLTNTDWGMGESSDLIDVASFEACGNTLFDENFGLSMIWTRQTTVEDFSNEVMKHVNGVVFTNPRTGLHTMRLIRGGYDEGSLREINPDNANLLKFSRRVWGETTNEIVVTWTNPETEKEETVSLQDLGNISMQGAVISASRNFYGVRSGDLAMQLAARELRVAASPLCTCDIELDRSAWDILPADVIALTWPEFGVVALPMRVGSVDYGRIGDSKIKITLVEDVFALPTSHYEAPPSTEFTGGRELPLPVTVSKVFTLPAYTSAGIVTGGLPSLVYPNAYAGVLAQAPSGDSQSFELVGTVASSTGSLVWAGKGTMPFTGHGTLSAPIVAEVTSTVPAFSGGSTPEVAGFGIIGDGSDEGSEIVLFTAYSEASGWSVKRGVLDTVPANWPTGTPIWFLSKSSSAYDSTALSAGLSPQYKLLTNTSLGQLGDSDAPVIIGTLTERPHLPLRPANLKVDTVGFGTRDGSGLASVSVSWATRNRLTEETIVLGWGDGSTPGEIGQTTTLEINGDDGVRVKTITGIIASPYTLNLSSFGRVGDININAYAVKGLLKSLQAHTVRVSNIGQFRVTDAGDVRVTDTGLKRIVNLTGAPLILTEQFSGDMPILCQIGQLAEAARTATQKKIVAQLSGTVDFASLSGTTFVLKAENGPVGRGDRAITYSYTASSGESYGSILMGLANATPVTSDGAAAGITVSYETYQSGAPNAPVFRFPLGDNRWEVSGYSSNPGVTFPCSIIALGLEGIAVDLPQKTDFILLAATFTGTPIVGDTFKITLDGVVFSYVVVDGDTHYSVMAALGTLIDADAKFIVSYDAPSGEFFPAFRVTRSVANTTFSYSGVRVRG